MTTDGGSRGSENHRAELALRVVVEEARRAEVPELTPEFEERLLAALVTQSVAPAPRRRMRALPAVLAVAAIAVAALGYALWPEATNEPAPRATAQAVPAPLDGDAVATPIITADRDPLEVQHRGRARWWLEPGSRARIQETKERIRITLSRGALRAEVVPSTQEERFVVEAGEARVAVHGTVFRVALDGGESLVDVSEGTVSVSVRARDGAAIEPVLLHAPAHGKFGGASTPPAKGLRRPRSARATDPAGKPAPEAAIASVPPALSSELPSELTPAEIDAGVTEVLQAVTRCFTEHLVPEQGRRVRVRSSLTLAVAAEGSVTNALFSPPLAPPVQACAEREIQSLRFAPTRRGATVTRIIDLSR